MQVKKIKLQNIFYGINRNIQEHNFAQTLSRVFQCNKCRSSDKQWPFYESGA